MQNLKRALLAIPTVLVLLWFVAEPTVVRSASLLGLRAALLQVTGIVAIGCMSLALLLALRPRWPERWLGGLDKMYRLHKWMGIASLIVAILHWVLSQAPRWAVGLGWLQRTARRPRPPIANPLEAGLRSLHGTAASLGKWAFYASVILIALALIRYVPYRFFYRTHRLLAIAYLALAFHAVVLIRFAYWRSPIGWVLALLLASGVWAALLVLLRRVGVSRQVAGTIAALHYYPGVRALETEIELQPGWPGHKAGQFAFAMSDASEGAHPYTIASFWQPERPRITFITKELGDHTSRLRDSLRVGQRVRVEGPYGYFTFDDTGPVQIWVGGGIGITPFIARMKHLALQSEAPDWPEAQMVELFHTTADVDEDALDQLAADAKAARIRLHVLIDSRDGRLTGERIRAAVPRWREASVWFCGPVGFGDTSKRDLAANGFPVQQRFHQELFAMR